MGVYTYVTFFSILLFVFLYLFRLITNDGFDDQEIGAKFLPTVGVSYYCPSLRAGYLDTIRFNCSLPKDV